MFYFKPLSLCTHFIEQVNAALLFMEAKPLSRAQKLWFSICITGVIVTNSVCWRRFERAGLGRFCAKSISKMFRRGKIDWNRVLMASVMNICQKYGISEGVLALDGTDNKRSKNTTTIAKVHSIKDKTSGGFIKGQALTVLVLITDKITLPMGFNFHEPDPTYNSWQKKDKTLRKKGIKKNLRPTAPERDSNYKSMMDCA